jgi:3,4-dihydroxy 2-butanone 4-phosphate synthase/3,4-dihydroxy 2-butanone 4-phosphate synthase/GTP cyclohydrolase II
LDGVSLTVAEVARDRFCAVVIPATRDATTLGGLAAGTGTGVSASERAATVRRLTHPGARPGDFLRPGHVFPLRARPGLLAERAGHTEATVAACVAAGLPPVGVCCEVMNPDGVMAGAADIEAAALRWGLPLIDVTDLRTWL